MLQEEHSTCLLKARSQLLRRPVETPKTPSLTTAIILGLAPDRMIIVRNEKSKADPPLIMEQYGVNHDQKLQQVSFFCESALTSFTGQFG